MNVMKVICWVALGAWAVYEIYSLVKAIKAKKAIKKAVDQVKDAQSETTIEKQWGMGFKTPYQI